MKTTQETVTMFFAYSTNHGATGHSVSRERAELTAEKRRSLGDTSVHVRSFRTWAQDAETIEFAHHYGVA